MTSDMPFKATSFVSSQSVFGAFDPESRKLLLIVEAISLEDAKTHIDAVAPLLGVKQASDLLVQQMDEMLSGVPTFLKAFFETGKSGINHGNVVPGSSTLQ